LATPIAWSLVNSGEPTLSLHFFLDKAVPMY
jgi:hypothetical protein